MAQTSDTDYTEIILSLFYDFLSKEEMQHENFLGITDPSTILTQSCLTLKSIKFDKVLLIRSDPMSKFLKFYYKKSSRH